MFEIDSGVFPHKDFINHLYKDKLDTFDYLDKVGHGTHVAGLILSSTCDEVKLRSCNYYNQYSNKTSIYNFINCLIKAIDEKPDIINISAGGPEFNLNEYDAITRLEYLNIPVVVAAGNENNDLTKVPYYPASYPLKNIIPVGNIEDDGQIHQGSNWNAANEVWERGVSVLSTLPNNKYGLLTGTSMSTAVRTNRILKKMCKEVK